MQLKEKRLLAAATRDTVVLNDWQNQKVPRAPLTVPDGQVHRADRRTGANQEWMAPYDCMEQQIQGDIAALSGGAHRVEVEHEVEHEVEDEVEAENLIEIQADAPMHAEAEVK